jgi:hypothetical protein
MSSPAEELYKGLNSIIEIEQLISNGETEGPYLECKSPQSPQINPGIKSQLAEAISGFANSGGGVIIWGVSTTKHSHGNLDVLSQIEPIGNCRNFAKQIDKHVPLLTTPSVNAPPSMVILMSKSDTRGIIITYIPPSQSDPVQSSIDKQFHFRNGDEFSDLPYEILKRMFLGTQGPDLSISFDSRLVKLEDNGFWKIPFVVNNNSSAVAEHSIVLVEIINPDACQQITPSQFVDISYINPGNRVFQLKFQDVIHRGFPQVGGELKVLMKKTRISRRVLQLRVTCYASRMRAKVWKLRIQLAKSGFKVNIIEEKFLY